jgi:glycine hydroxymethyltransferase
MSLSKCDPELNAIIQLEEKRQKECLELIASENFTSEAVRECLGSCLTNKYSEGYPGARYYGGTEHIDTIEMLCQQRALDAFKLDHSAWAVNVQPYSGSPANLAVYTALLKPHDRIMGLDLPSGGHLTHGFITLSRNKDGTVSRKPVSATSIFFESMPYSVDPVTGFLDYYKIEELVRLYKPNLIICGASAYPRDWDYTQMRKIADSVGAYLMADIAHIAGLVATGHAANPFDVCDIVTTTTHKSLRGPRAGMVFSRRDERQLPAKIDAAVFPGLQGGPHQHQIAAIATQLREVATPQFAEYIKQVCANSKALAGYLIGHGFQLATGGTDNHLLLWKLKPLGLTGGKVQALCDAVNITLNKNTVHGDNPAIPTGVRIGASALTTRGMKEVDFIHIGGLLRSAIELAQRVNAAAGPGSNLAAFVAKMPEFSKEITILRESVRDFVSDFRMPMLVPVHEASSSCLASAAVAVAGVVK